MASMFFDPWNSGFGSRYARPQHGGWFEEDDVYARYAARERQERLMAQEAARRQRYAEEMERRQRYAEEMERRQRYAEAMQRREELARQRHYEELLRRQHGIPS